MLSKVKYIPFVYIFLSWNNIFNIKPRDGVIFTSLLEKPSLAIALHRHFLETPPTYMISLKKSIRVDSYL